MRDNYFTDIGVRDQIGLETSAQKGRAHKLFFSCASVNVDGYTSPGQAARQPEPWAPEIRYNVGRDVCTHRQQSPQASAA
jgi:hypothetical protein